MHNYQFIYGDLNLDSHSTLNLKVRDVNALVSIMMVFDT